MAVILVELAAFVVVLFVLWRYVKPLLQQMVRDRQDQIQQQVDASDEAIRRLQEATRRLEDAEVEARKEVAKIRDDARADATRIAEELQEQADREVERIRQRGQEQLAAAARPHGPRPARRARCGSPCSWPSGSWSTCWPTTGGAAPRSTSSCPTSTT